MLGSILPGLRELRAPLAAGYLWLVFAWLAWGDMLPTAGEIEDGSPLDRLQRLEPVISDLGLAVVASVTAYILGSIVIDVQVRVGTFVRIVRGRGAGFLLTDAGRRTLHQWEMDRQDELAEEIVDAAARRVVAQREGVEATHDADRDEDAEHRGAVQTVRRQLDERIFEARVTPESWFPLLEDVERATREYIVDRRDLLKSRLLDVSQPRHSEVDRPDAEGTFRMALWPPLSALVIYLAVAVSWPWMFAMVLPALLAWQWIGFRRQANAELVTAFVDRDELGGELAKREVRRVAGHFAAAKTKTGNVLERLIGPVAAPSDPPSGAAAQ
jgi:hypothetical protein